MSDAEMGGMTTAERLAEGVLSLWLAEYLDGGPDRTGFGIVLLEDEAREALRELEDLIRSGIDVAMEMAAP